ncbi:MAG: DUF190 domain-containing protein [Phycisphaerae bacterium]
MIGEKVLLRLYMRSAELYHFAPAYERVVQQAAQHKLAGVTVLRGIMGLGSRGLVRHSEFKLVGDSPIIVECVDDGDKLITFLQDITQKLLHHGLVTLERAGVVMYRSGTPEAHNQMRLLSSVKPLSTLPDIQGVLNMHTDFTGVLLRIFIGESDTFEHKPLHEAIVTKARQLGISGATVLQGSMGFGANTVIHNDRVLVMSSDLPLVIEIVETREKIEQLLPLLDDMVKGGMITMEDVRVIAYRHNPAATEKKAIS